jgi:hypothetical protein
MRTRIHFTITLLLPLLLGSVGWGAFDQGWNRTNSFGTTLDWGMTKFKPSGTETLWRSVGPRHLLQSAGVHHLLHIYTCLGNDASVIESKPQSS